MRTFLTLFLAAICVVGYAQKKPKINQALSALEDGELSEAKSIIDAAIVHEKTKDDPKTWYYRGQIYAALDTANNEEGALDESLKAFDRALELDPAQKSFNSVDFNTGQVVNIDSKKQGYYAFYYNNAITAYNEDLYEEAADNFETAYYIMPSDTNAILNAAYASSAAGDAKRAEASFKKCYEAGMKDKSIFLQLYNYAAKDERLEEALAYIKDARKVYPDDIDLAKYEINLLIRLDRTDEAMTEIESSIKAEPNNADLLFSLGVLKDETGDKEGAMETYKKAISVNPDHFNSYFNIGAMLFNETNALVKEQGALNYYPGKSSYKAEEKKRYQTLDTAIEEKLNESLPVWEKLHSLRSDEPDVMTSLIYVYKGLGMLDKAKEIQAKLDALN
ncbi:tetratricopeptide repeat protein [Ekhidna sp. To15]|uniref:tetratricopeptide repeat protein n=1 Tax=Ekhidna sp. To15 TaxID=3395267 RepID=UPI003F520B6C